MLTSKAIIIFGGTGDLSYRKLYPALYDLYKLGKLSQDFKILGIGRREYDDKEYSEIIRPWVKKFSRLEYKDEEFESFCRIIKYYMMDFSDEDKYNELGEYFGKSGLTKDIICYYAVSPEYFMPITTGLSKIVDDIENIKIIIEKPFGKDIKSAEELNKKLRAYIKDENIYYIDHYLGKEMLLNIMTIRFFNSMFNGVWNNNFIDNIQINVFEDIGVESRGGYYDKAGAIADMLQNHLFQILSIVAMDEPEDFDTKNIKESQTKIFKQLRKFPKEEIDDYIVLGQYKNYRDEDKVDKNSTTETYVAAKVFVDNERWMDVPFYLRTGKKLKTREIEIIIQFKPTKNAIKMVAADYANADLTKIFENNYLSIRIQPDEGINLRFNVKKTGSTDEIDIANLNYCQSCLTENVINTPQAYERLLESSIKSNRTLFSTWEQIQVSWEYMDEVLKMYRGHSNKLYEYEQGSFGPKEADEILKKDGRKWIYTQE